MHIGSIAWHAAKTYLCNSTYSAQKLGTHSASCRPFCQRLVAAKNEKAQQELRSAQAQKPVLEALLENRTFIEHLVMDRIERKDKAGLELLRKESPAHETACITASNIYQPIKDDLARLEAQISKLEPNCQRYALRLAELAQMQRS